MDFDEEESIYNLIPPAAATTTKQNMHRSKHNPKAAPSYSTFGVAGTARTVANASGVETVNGPRANTVSAARGGRTTTGVADPKQFLKKGASQNTHAQTVVIDTHAPPKPFHRTDGDLKKPGVPTRADKPIMGLKSEKNFVVSNAVECILSVPKKGVPPTQSGASTSFTAPAASAVSKATYGQVPSYIHKVKKELQTQYDEVTRAKEDAEDQKKREERLMKLSSDEVQELMDGLRAKWAQCNKAFQTMSFSMETSTQIRKRDELEKQMKTLEDAMKRLDKRFLFVYDDTS